MTASRAQAIRVLAGVNGAGKSSIGGRFLEEAGSDYYNPDEAARQIRSLHPRITPEAANGQAWQIGRDLLEQSITQSFAFAFETTLGGKTITALLQRAAEAGRPIEMWFAGLASIDLHLQRVADRVRKGGHPIPEVAIRQRWTRSRENLVTLLPHLHHLRLFDNSREADPSSGERPSPELLLEMIDRRITAPANLRHVRDWAKPLIAAAANLHGRK
jgi:predicted ABC-type ATPase